MPKDPNQKSQDINIIIIIIIEFHLSNRLEIGISTDVRKVAKEQLTEPEILNLIYIS